MTVRELIDILNELDPKLVVVYSTQEDTYEPSPVIKKYEFNTTYYTTDKGFITLPKNVEFLEL